MKTCLVSNPRHKEWISDIKEIHKLLEKNNIEVVPDTSVGHVFRKTSPLEKIDPDIVIVVGGDGTFLRTFIRLSTREIPVLTINAGGVGFLAEVDSSKFAHYVKRLRDEDYFIERRKRLMIEIDGEESPCALNEISIFPLTSATLMRYTLKINDEVVWRDGADGVIVSTPTGSTGHALSAGGVIVSPDADCLIITPVSSIKTSTRPLVVSDMSLVHIHNIFSKEKCEYVLDGQIRKKLKVDRVHIRKAEKDALFIKFSRDKYSKLTGKLKKRIIIYEENIQNLSPSEKFLLKILQYEDIMTQKELIEESKLPERTVRRAIQQLLKRNLITKIPSVRDTRQDLYKIR